MMTRKGNNRLTGNISFCEIIPTRFPKAGEATRRVSLAEALEIADAFYNFYTIEELTKKDSAGDNRDD